MNFSRSWAGIEPRTRWLRLSLLAAALLGMLCCLPLWLNSRAYPLAPLVPELPQLSAPGDRLLLVTVLGSLIGAAWAYRSCVGYFLVATFYLFLGDQNRGQPWLYLYWVLLWLSLWPGASGLAAMRVAISISYLWAGVQKLNPVFFKAIPTWFVSPAQPWGCPDWLLHALRLAVAAAPLLEIGIGIGLWIAGTRRWTLAAVVGLHLTSLVFLGPLGHNVNLVVWPWNLAMIVLVLLLFPVPEKASSLSRTWSALRRAPGLLGLLAGFSCLPVLSYWGWWPSYFSFALYSANTARADIYVSESFHSQLPPGLVRYVEPVKDFDPNFQQPFVFAHLKWAAAELGVPGIPEPAAFAAVFRTLSESARDGRDCHMIVGTRDGRVLWFAPGMDSPKAVGE